MREKGIFINGQFGEISKYAGVGETYFKHIIVIQLNPKPKSFFPKVTLNMFHAFKEFKTFSGQFWGFDISFGDFEMKLSKQITYFS